DEHLQMRCKLLLQLRIPPFLVEQSRRPLNPLPHSIHLNLGSRLASACLQLLTSSLRPPLLLMPQRCHRIHPHRSPRRNPTSRYRDEHQENADARKHRGSRWCHLNWRATREPNQRPRGGRPLATPISASLAPSPTTSRIT